MSENEDTEGAGGNSPLKLIILVVVVVGLVGALVYSMNKSKSLTAEGLPPPKPVDPNAPKREFKMPELSGDKMMKIMMNAKKGQAGNATDAAAPAEAAPAEESAPAEAEPAPAN